ncbi:MAG: helix-turn-helix transcriptional regulator [Acidimicrobiales bacterium]|jgi:DNA-binding XRE family transcriptional regulator
MARTLNAYLQRSKRANSPEVSAARAAFEQAYGIACQVIELREKHNLTQVELAEKAGLPQAQISRIERGVVSPTSATLGKIAEALGADLRLVERPQPSARRRAAN